MLYLIHQMLRDWLSRHDAYAIFSPLDEIQFRALAAVGVAFALVLAFGRPTIRRLIRMKIGDSGITDAEALRETAITKANTPTMGGVLICGAIGLSTLLFADLLNFYVQLGLVILVWLSVLGGFDDWLKLTASRRGDGRQGLYAWEKLVFQLGIAVLAGVFIYRQGNTESARDVAHVLNLPFQKTYVSLIGGLSEGLIFLPMGAFVLIATLMIAGVSNAANITDGMDGLATGISGIVSLSLLLLALIAGTEPWAHYLLVPNVVGSDELAVLAGAMAGACLGFLWWNCAPAMVFMGDTGSLALGGLIGYLAVVLRQEVVALILCGVFLVEIGSVILQVGYFKLTGGKRIFRCAPFHHHLHLGGWAEQQVVARLWIVSILLAVIGLASIKVR
ncbi:MAG: phospho-N-acetylmuramoyl-pentapeptide-transferase [Leptolyngbya sp. PLA3]|nr:MAG: phospho-N-acetylmuramoyl-pentapeptide-transferase [Cyanobacteria bacterium CYA]MCE7969218.1 phospho-N-acetylmuramoyl-pentapeptide-transferase [Leptolyngbya sp. PL-A3]